MKPVNNRFQEILESWMMMYGICDRKLSPNEVTSLLRMLNSRKISVILEISTTSPEVAYDVSKGIVWPVTEELTDRDIELQRRIQETTSKWPHPQNINIR